ncbi:MAG: AraC family transcriptional regulator [Butyrivibrio sp.]|nr:AraC family transcriptional regulator [Butyrivibrio sp.]
MKLMPLPTNQIYAYHLSGKFKALSSEWKHEKFPLSDYELIVMTEGELYLRYNGNNYTVKKGEYLLLPPSDTGFREGFKEAYCSFYWMHFNSKRDNITPLEINYNSKESEKIDKEKNYLIPQSAAIPKLERLVVMMKQLQDMAKNNYPIISLNSMTTSIMLELYGEISVGSPVYNDPASKKQIYLDIIDYIQTNISRNIKISEIADAFGYNPKYLSHLFVEIRDIPLKQFILSQKIDAANFMLADNDKSITQIAMDLGFSDVHNFARMYKKSTGLTPSEYRNAFSKRLLFHV